MIPVATLGKVGEEVGRPLIGLIGGEAVVSRSTVAAEIGAQVVRAHARAPLAAEGGRQRILANRLSMSETTSLTGEELAGGSGD